MKKTSKALALVLAASMVAMTGCGNATPDNGGAVTGSSTDGTTQGSSDVAVVEDGATYTYRNYTSTFPTNWSPHQEQTNYDATLMNYLCAPFYEFDYNETEDGYKIVPLAVTGEPVDVTADYAGSFGIEAGETAKAWKFTLNDNLMWSDGTKITAQDYVDSAELLLNPVAQNYRADSLYQGNMVIVNAKNYLYQGQHAYSATMISPAYGDDEYVAPADLTVGDDGVLYFGDSDLAVKYTTDLASWSSNSLEAYYNAYGADMFTVDGVDQVAIIADAADADGLVKVTPEIMDALQTVVAILHGYTSADEYAAEEAGDYAYLEFEEMCYLGETFSEVSFDEVGVKAVSDNELVLILAQPLEGFYLLYSLTDSWLVKTDLYKACESVVDGVYTNTYGTSVETSASYGPFVLESFQADKEYALVKNDKYVGAKEGTYQTTNLVVKYVAEHSTALEMFLNGELDVYGLDADDMEAYASSDYTYYATGDSTFFVALNPDLEALKAEQAKLGDNYNKTILTVKEFRMALSFALDRASFALATSPTNSAAFGIFSSTIISNPEEGTAYRTTPEAKQVLADFWGVAEEIGAGKLYEDIDEAIDSITGYNPEQGKLLFDKAYDIAVEQGLIDDDDIVEIRIGIPNSSSQFYSKGYDFLVNCYTDAVKGTKLEGRLQFSVDDTLGNAFSNALKSNQVDMLFGVGWTGSALDPYGLMEAYTSSSYQYDPSWDTTKAPLTIQLSDGTYTASVWDWTDSMAGTVITIFDADGNAKEFSAGTSDDNADDRFAILAALEGAVLATYDLLPLIDDASAQLKSMKVEYYTEEYIFGMDFGGLKYYSYNYSDEEWAAFVAEQGGTLNYK